MKAERTPIAMRLDFSRRTAICERRSARAASATMPTLRTNRISGTGTVAVSHLTIASCTLNAAQAVAARAIPVSVGEASALAADKRAPRSRRKAVHRRFEHKTKGARRDRLAQKWP